MSLKSAWVSIRDRGARAASRARPYVERSIIRGGAWCFGVFVGVFPAVQTAKVDFSIVDFWGMVTAINAKGSFRDFLFIIITISVVGITNIGNFLAFGNPSPRLGSFAKTALIAVIFGLVGSAMYGMSAFAGIAPNEVLGDAAYQAYISSIRSIMVVGLAVEVVLVVAEAVPHTGAVPPPAKVDATS